MPKRNRAGAPEGNDLDQYNKAVFAENIDGLVRTVLRLSPADAAARIGVEVNWMRKMCAKGVGRPDPRTRPQLEKVAEFFRIPINAFWEPGLLIWIWAGRSYPEAREHFVSDFHLDQVLKENPKLYREWLNQMEYREDLEDLQRDRREKLVPPLPNPDRPAPKYASESPTAEDSDLQSFLARAEETQDPAFVETARRLVAQVATKETEPTKSEMLEMLLSTGRYEYLKNLIGDLYSAEKQRIRK